MKLNFTVDLDDKEILGEDLVNAIKGEARKITREEFSKEVTTEINRITKMWVEDKSYAWHEGKIERAMHNALQNEIKNDESFVSQAFNEAKNILIENLNKYINVQVSQLIEDQVKEQLPQAIFDLLKKE